MLGEDITGMMTSDSNIYGNVIYRTTDDNLVEPRIPFLFF